MENNKLGYYRYNPSVAIDINNKFFLKNVTIGSNYLKSCFIECNNLAFCGIVVIDYNEQICSFFTKNAIGCLSTNSSVSQNIIFYDKFVKKYRNIFAIKYITSEKPFLNQLSIIKLNFLFINSIQVRRLKTVETILFRII